MSCLAAILVLVLHITIQTAAALLGGHNLLPYLLCTGHFKLQLYSLLFNLLLYLSCKIKLSNGFVFFYEFLFFFFFLFFYLSSLIFWLFCCCIDPLLSLGGDIVNVYC